MAKGKKETPETLEQAIEQIELLEEKLASYEATIKQQEGWITELNEKKVSHEETIKQQESLIAEIRTQKQSGPEAPTFTLKNKTFKVNAASFKYENKHYTASELCENAELQAELVELGVGFIEEVAE